VLGLADDLVLAVEHVLGVVELAGDRVADLVEQFERITPGHDAVGGHRDAPGLLEDRDQLVKSLEHPVHPVPPSNHFSPTPVCR
jgi:hypothetical protein